MIIQSIADGQSQWAVIDCHNPNPKQDSPTLQFLKSNHVNNLELVMLTHPDYDHYSGLRQLIEYYSQNGRGINKFKGVIKTSEQIKGSINSLRERELYQLFDLVQNLSRKNIIEYSYIASDVTISMANVILKALSPFGNEMDRFQSQATKRSVNPKTHVDKNSISAIIALEGLGFQNLLCADASKNVIETVLVNWKKTKKGEQKKTAFDVIKVAHHGSEKNHSKNLWINFTSKRKSHAIISAGEGYGHPEKQTVDDIISNEVNLYCTNRCGCLKDYNKRLLQNLRDSGLKSRIIDAIEVTTLPIPNSSSILHGDITAEFQRGSLSVNTQTNLPPL